MRNPDIACLSCLIFCPVLSISLSLGFILACSTTPNLPHQGRVYPDNFSQIALSNRLLAYELSKSPEFQDGISEEESKALKIIGKLYQKKPEAFDSAFNKMYTIGLPEVRKFCSPLQALFWLAEDGELQGNMDLVHNYTLKTLLDKSWTFEASIKISEDQINKTVNGIKNKNMKEDYLARRKRLSTPMFLKVINDAYKRNKPEDITDLERLLNPRKPKIAEKKVGHNEPCPCGSGNKYKKCCVK